MIALLWFFAAVAVVSVLLAILERLGWIVDTLEDDHES